MAYVSQDFKKSVAPKIKAICQKYGVKGTLSVRNHSALVLTVRQGKIDFIGDFNQTIQQRDPSGARRINPAKDHIQVNTFWYHEHYTGAALEFFNEIVPALKGPKYFDHSDISTDYFHCSHYIDINVGEWDRPYALVK